MARAGIVLGAVLVLWVRCFELGTRLQEVAARLELGTNGDEGSEQKR